MLDCSAADASMASSYISGVGLASPCSRASSCFLAACSCLSRLPTRTLACVHSGEALVDQICEIRRLAMPRYGRPSGCQHPCLLSRRHPQLWAPCANPGICSQLADISCTVFGTSHVQSELTYIGESAMFQAVPRHTHPAARASAAGPSAPPVCAWCPTAACGTLMHPDRIPARVCTPLMNSLAGCNMQLNTVLRYTENTTPPHILVGQHSLHTAMCHNLQATVLHAD